MKLFLSILFISFNLSAQDQFIIEANKNNPSYLVLAREYCQAEKPKILEYSARPLNYSRLLIHCLAYDSLPTIQYLNELGLLTRQIKRGLFAWSYFIDNEPVRNYLKRLDYQEFSLSTYFIKALDGDYGYSKKDYLSHKLDIKGDAVAKIILKHMYNFKHESPENDILIHLLYGADERASWEYNLLRVIDKRMNGALLEDRRWYLLILLNSGKHYREYRDKLVHRLTGYYKLSPKFQVHGVDVMALFKKKMGN